MKKLFYILILITGFANAQIVNIPDANFKLKLIQLGVDTNGDAQIQISEALNVDQLNVDSSNISSLEGIELFTNLTSLQCGLNNLTSLNVNNLIFLETLICSYNQLTSLDVSSLTNLQTLYFQNNDLVSIDISNLTNLTGLQCSNNNLTSLDISNSPNLDHIACGNNQLVFLDASKNPLICVFECSSMATLNRINLKNGSILCLNNKILSNNPNLKFLCVNNNAEAFYFQNYFQNNNMQNVNVNSYCTFVPGGNFNSIEGTISFDVDNNGCDVLDYTIPNIKVDIVQDENTAAVFSNNDGGYVFFINDGNFDVSISTENPTWFNVSPATASVSFTDINNNQTTQNFCVTPNGVHPDLEIVITPINPARPGFDATYKIVYRNKGNQTLSQQYGINFFYNQNLMEYVSASVAPSQMVAGGISWDYANLQPFESREIVFTLNINAPTDTNPVNNDDVLTFTTSIMPQAGDENTADNTFVLDQTVVGSYDPNDITCLEGDIVSPSEIGEYLHYNIRFENTGTFFAENIVVKTEINPAEFDINTLQLLNASHPVDARIRGNIIEFIFKEIYLQTGGHGNVLLKVKTKPSLQTGDLVKNKANIYFDYNFPILTNDAETVFQSLSNPDFEVDNSVKIYPNPSNALVNIKSDFNIKSIQLYDVQGRILQTNIVEENATSLDISSKAKGIYFLKVITDKGIKVEKLVKE